jgi:glutaminase
MAVVEVSTQEKKNKTHKTLSTDKKYLDIFNALDKQNTGRIKKQEIVDTLNSAGISLKDPRLSSLRAAFSQISPEQGLDFKTFKKCVKHSILLIAKAISGELIIPDFTDLCHDIEDIYKKTKSLEGGNVADYIPQLKRVDPEKYGVSVCSIDGQRFDLGDTRDIFCVQSSCKPINYCIALESMGEEFVHKHVCHEPSGRGFNELTLTDSGLPHNPLINSGAIMTSSMIKPDLNIADRFDYVIQMWRDLAGGQIVGFNNAVYLSERQTADRNFALGYFMKEHNAFPPNTNLLEILEFYFQCCSIETTTRAMSVVASTLANGGVCPITEKQIFSPSVVKNCLSLMYSCGMYDFSGEFAFSIGLPAKSGVSGIVIVVVPNLMGFAVWSPKLDSHGNSFKGIQFCKELSNLYNIHNYDSLVSSYQNKKDPRRRKSDINNRDTMDLCWAASRGDLKNIQQMLASGLSLDRSDYDGRTPLHLAAAEGNLEIVSYLLAHSKTLNAKDRWGSTPLDDAKRGQHKKIVKYLEDNGGK